MWGPGALPRTARPGRCLGNPSRLPRQPRRRSRPHSLPSRSGRATGASASLRLRLLRDPGRPGCRCRLSSLPPPSTWPFLKRSQHLPRQTLPAQRGPRSPAHSRRSVDACGAGKTRRLKELRPRQRRDGAVGERRGRGEPRLRSRGARALERAAGARSRGGVQDARLPGLPEEAGGGARPDRKWGGCAPKRGPGGGGPAALPCPSAPLPAPRRPAFRRPGWGRGVAGAGATATRCGSRALASHPRGAHTLTCTRTLVCPRARSLCTRVRAHNPTPNDHRGHTTAAAGPGIVVLGQRPFTWGPATPPPKLHTRSYTKTASL